MLNNQLVVLHCISSIKVSGTTQLLLNNIRNCGHRFTHHVAYFLPRHDLKSGFIDAGCHIHFIPHFGLVSAPRVIGRLSAIVRSEGVDIIHSNLLLDSVYARGLSLICGVPVLRTLVDAADPALIQSMAGDHAPSRRARILQANVRFTANEFVAVSEAAKRSYVDYYRVPEARVNVVHSGVDISAFAAEWDESALARIRVELGLSDGDIVLLSVGRLHWNKGHRYLIPMIKELSDRWPRIRLLIAGDGEERSFLEAEIARYGVQKYVTLLGRREDVADLLGICDVFVFPSVAEALGYGVLEAMIAGIPVVASNVGGIPEAIRNDETGILVDAKSPAQLAAAVDKLLRKPDVARRLAASGRADAVMRFDIQRNVAKLEEIYLKVVRTSRTASRNNA